MTHPVEQLVDYVDGTLPARERAVVRAHLQTCARCRDEVTLSAGAKRALAELPDVQAPVGLGSAAARGAESGTDPGAAGVATLTPRRDREATATPAWYRWGGAAAAIAAAFIVAVLVLPKVGGDGGAVPANAPAAESTARSGDAGFRAAGGVERQQKDYDVADVQELAESYGVLAGPPPTAEDRGVEAGGSQVPAASGAGVPGALACLEHAFPYLADGGPPVELVEARFQGTPAYLGVFASGPGAGEDADMITVWVASSADCSVLHSTQFSI